MQGRKRTARASAERLEAGTYQMVLDRAYVEIGMPKAEHCKKDEATGRMKTPEESAYAQAVLVWKDQESGAEVKDKFLKLPEFLEFSEDTRYKSKFQKRIENMLNKQLDDNAGEKLTLNFEFVESWDEMMEAIREKEGDRFITLTVAEFKWDGHLMFGHEWLVTVDLNDKGYNNVSTVAPLPKRRGAPAQPAATTAAPATQAAAPAQKAPPARPERPAPAPVAEPGEVDLPF